MAIKKKTKKVAKKAVKKSVTKKSVTKPAIKHDFESIFTPDGIKDLISFVGKSDVAEVEISGKDKNLFITKAVSQPQGAISPVVVPQQQVVAPALPATLAAPSESAPVVSSGYAEVKSPLVGTFYKAPSPDADDFIKVGDTISKGKVICTIEAMKIFNEIKSEVNGVVKEICIDNEQPIEYGQIICLVDSK